MAAQYALRRYSDPTGAVCVRRWISSDTLNSSCFLTSERYDKEEEDDDDDDKGIDIDTDKCTERVSDGER